MDRALTQQQLADAAGIARGYLATLESGRANPSLKVVTRIAEALDLEVDLVVRHRPSSEGTTSRTSSTLGAPATWIAAFEQPV